MEFVASALVFLSLLLLLEDQFYHALKANLLTVKQAQRNGYQKVLPFLWHTGMYGDVVICFWCSYIVGKYGEQWHVYTWLSIGLGFLIISIIPYLFWKKQARINEIPEAHSETPAGLAHLVYMAIALPIITLFFFGTTGIPSSLVIGSAVFFWVHVTLSHHFVPALYCMRTGQTWYPRRPWKTWYFWWLTPTIAALLIWGTMVALKHH